MPTIKDLVAKRKELESRLIVKALEDDAFRRRLLSDPKAAVAEMTGEAMPAGVEVRVIEESPNSVTFVVPHRPAEISADEELSDEALEGIAGMGLPPIPFINVVVHG